MAKEPWRSIRAWLRVFLSMQARIRGGLRETEPNELTVIPRIPPSRQVVRIDTPLPQRRKALLNRSACTGTPPSHRRDRPAPVGRPPADRHIIPTSPVPVLQGPGRIAEEAVGRAGRGEGIYNVVVIGAGTAGLVTAAGTAALGGRVALVERGRMGGDCLNYGCVPSKALIRSARVAALMRRADLVALDPARPAIDFGRVIRRVKAVRAKLEPHDS